MFSFFRKKLAPTPVAAPEPAPPAAPTPAELPRLQPAPASPLWPAAVAPAARPAETAAAAPAPAAPAAPPARHAWLNRLTQGLRKTGGSITQVFTGTRIDDALYEDLEAALLQADAGVSATAWLLDDLKRRVKTTRTTEPAAVKALLVDAVAELLQPLQQPLVIGRHLAATGAEGSGPTVIMVAGVNGAGKTTTIGKLTRHLADQECKVLLAAADTFRAAAREQLAVWATRAEVPQAVAQRVEIVSQEGGDPAAVSFDAVQAGRARGCDVVIADTAGRLPTQLHLMAELEKIKRTLAKAQAGAPHEVLLVVDGNTGQNALTQVQAFDKALGLTGLVVTKLDGTAKGGVLAAIARWAAQQGRVVPVYFIGIGEKLEDLQTFDAREFARALLG
jgi:fused signal recognition particle receptor